MKIAATFFALALLLCAQTQAFVLTSEKLESYADSFNAADNELYVQYVPNLRAKEFLKRNVPLFECPDSDIESVYYFRWWTYRKHIKQTPEGFVITEFLPPVRWAGKYNTISCAAALHFREGRWLADKKYLSDYARFWFFGGGDPQRYSFWPADSVLNFHYVHPDKQLLADLYPKLVENFEKWRNTHFDNGLFWQTDNRDGMECSISGKTSKGKGYRATINSYMFAELKALSKIAEILGNGGDADKYAEAAEKLKRSINALLWDKSAQFYKVIPYSANGQFSRPSELHGYTPWLFDIPPAEYSSAWKQIALEDGFKAPFGLTTAERRDADFAVSYEGHECLWDGPVWPYATSITLAALANFLNNYSAAPVSKNDYFDALKTYAKSHRRTREDGKTVFWIDENINPFTGDWISRTRLKTWENATWSDKKGGVERGKDYNHSLFCDLVISGLVGLRIGENSVAVNPLVPDDWAFFCLDNVACGAGTLTVLYDKDGSRYGRGAGLSLFLNGKLVKKADKIQKLELKL